VLFTIVTTLQKLPLFLFRCRKLHLETALQLREDNTPVLVTRWHANRWFSWTNIASI
jgi:hypothetical protein